MKIIWSPTAVERISEISEYIAQDNPSAAKKWIDTVFLKVEQITPSHEIGRIVPEIGSRHFREILYGNYRIMYRVEKEQISILNYTPRQANIADR